MHLELRHIQFSHHNAGMNPEGRTAMQTAKMEKSRLAGAGSTADLHSQGRLEGLIRASASSGGISCTKTGGVL